jgi:hypothetical protein
VLISFSSIKIDSRAGHYKIGRMNKVALFLSAFFFSFSALAGECFRSEIDPKTNKIYSSEKIYLDDIKEWQVQKPEVPGMFKLARAYSVYKKEKDFATSLGNDKRAHCYMGCRISQETDYHVAEYVGWLKEDQDIRDCKPTTHFDAADWSATNKGAQLGQSQPDAKGCDLSCKQNY